MRVGGKGNSQEKGASNEDITESQQDNGPRLRVWLMAGLLGAALVVIVVIVATVTCLSGDSSATDYPATNVRAAFDELQIVPRSDWSEEVPPELRELRHPTPYVVVKHTAGSTCSGLEQCGRILRDIRELHRQRYEQPDISYNFLIDSAGVVYEGRGWDATNVNRAFVLRCNVDVALIGNYAERNMTGPMSRALQQLLVQGVELGKLATDYRLLAHSQVFNTVSPGRWALQEIHSWDHRCLSHCDEGIQCP